jgi:hypothetical protein
MPAQKQQREFEKILAAGLYEEPFTLIDIGCHGGIDPRWLPLKEHLRAFAIDPSAEEIARLSASAPVGVEYIAALVDGRPKIAWDSTNPIWDRLSIAETLRIRARNQRPSPASAPADPPKSIFLPDFARDRNLTDIDFIKIDVDGPDFDILDSAAGLLSTTNVLGLKLEVNFHGGPNETDHTFHNTDRFMRRAGFELADLSITRYTMAALPGRYLLSIPAQSATGRPFQGDAIYVRDLCSPKMRDLAANLSDQKLLKLALIFSIHYLEDQAAEVLVAFRSRLAKHIDVGMALDTLAKHGISSAKDYASHMARFQSDSPNFYETDKQHFPANNHLIRLWNKLLSLIPR